MYYNLLLWKAGIWYTCFHGEGTLLYLHFTKIVQMCFNYPVRESLCLMRRSS